MQPGEGKRPGANGYLKKEDRTARVLLDLLHSYPKISSNQNILSNYCHRSDSMEK